MTHHRDIKIGSYVLATKYDDGDPGDHWVCGWFSGMTDHTPPRYDVVDNDGVLFRGNGFRRAEQITMFVGRQLLKKGKDEGLLYCGKSVWDIRDEIAMEDPDPLSLARMVDGVTYWAETLPWDKATMVIKMKSTSGLVQKKLVAQEELDPIIIAKEALIAISFDEFIRDCQVKIAEA